MHYEYKAENTCAQLISFDIEGDVVTNSNLSNKAVVLLLLTFTSFLLRLVTISSQKNPLLSTWQKWIF